MNTDNGIPEPGSLLDAINEFGRLVNDLSVSMGQEPTCKPITMKPITTKVARMRSPKSLLAQVDVPMSYAGEHWITIDVYGEKDTDESGKPILSDMRCYVHDEPADNFLPETLLQQICNEILSGDFD